MSAVPEARTALNQTIELLGSSQENCKMIETSYRQTHDLGERLIENLQLTIIGLAEYLSHVDKIGTATSTIADTYTKAQGVLTSAGLAQHEDGNRITEDLKDLARETGWFKNDTVDPVLQSLGPEHGILHVLEGLAPIAQRLVTEFEEEWSTPENFAAGISAVIRDCQTMRDGL